MNTNLHLIIIGFLISSASIANVEENLSLDISSQSLVVSRDNNSANESSQVGEPYSLFDNGTLIGIQGEDIVFFDISPTTDVMAVVIDDGTESSDNPIRIIDLVSGQQTHEFDRGTKNSSRPAFSPNGGMLAYCWGENSGNSANQSSVNNAVEIWDTATWTSIHTIPNQQCDSFSSLIFSPNNQKLVLWEDGNSTLAMWDINTWSIVAEWNGVLQNVFDFDFSPNGSYFALAKYSGNVEILSGNNLSSITIINSTYSSMTLEFSPNGDTLAVGSGYGGHTLFYTSNWTQKFQVSYASLGVEGHTDLIFIENGSVIVSAHNDPGAAIFIDSVTGQLLTYVYSGIDLRSIGVSQNGSVIIAVDRVSYGVIGKDSDLDSVVDALDDCPDDSSEHTDSDGDGYCDGSDTFPDDATETTDSDGDGIGDNGDVFPYDSNETADSDGDGIGDNEDVFPNDSNETTDFDGDGIGDNGDPDDDNDGVLDTHDAFPFDSEEGSDFDGDGIGDNQDGDDDNDGIVDAQDEFPYNANETIDSDADGVGDNSDAFPNDSTEQVDSDGDGVGDNSDAFPNDSTEQVDSDGDGVGDNSDAFPNDSTEQVDTDGDGVGDNSDTYPNDSSKWEQDDETGHTPGNTNPNETPGFETWLTILAFLLVIQYRRKIN